jgi:hypothetical protein
MLQLRPQVIEMLGAEVENNLAVTFAGLDTNGGSAAAFAAGRVGLQVNGLNRNHSRPFLISPTANDRAVLALS